MDKAPDAFRTISEVADDLDIPQHVLRFWETRFSQIRPMKRSGGRRYYRPDDVDLLKGIRHLLYGEGYTIRGVQRILKEQGLKSVQGLAAGAALPDTMRAAAQAQSHEADDDEDDMAESDANDLAPPNVPARTIRPLAPVMQPTAPTPFMPTPTLGDAARGRLQSALQDLVGCRQLLDEAMKRA